MKYNRTIFSEYILDNGEWILKSSKVVNVVNVEFSYNAWNNDVTITYDYGIGKLEKMGISVDANKRSEFIDGVYSGYVRLETVDGKYPNFIKFEENKDNDVISEMKKTIVDLQNSINEIKQTIEILGGKSNEENRYV